MLTTESIDAVVTDPPYGLGFMGKAWDTTGIANDVRVWRQCLRVLKPGGHLLAFGSTRTSHRMVCAIEDAGFEIRDTVAWLYGSGFPKSKNLTGEWQGWGSALKPAHEPIVLARRALRECTLEGNMARHETGALNIEGCRVPTSDTLGGEDCNLAAVGSKHSGSRSPRMEDPAAREAHAVRGQETVARVQALGRWPANVIHDGSDEVLAAFPDAPGQCADLKLGDGLKTSRVYGALRRERGEEPSANSENVGAVGFKMRPGARRLDTGSAARFFYCAKASRADRGADNDHPTVKPTALMAYLCRLVTPPRGTVLDPFMGSGSTGKAAMREGFRFIGIEADTANIEIARRRIERELCATLERAGQFDLMWA